MTAAAPEAIEFELRVEKYGRRLIHGEWVAGGTASGSPGAPMTGTYAEVSAEAVRLNKAQHDAGFWGWLYYPDPVGASVVVLKERSVNRLG